MGNGMLFYVGRGTLGLFARKQKYSVDALEAGRATPSDVRLAIEVDDADSTFHELVVADTLLMSHPIDAPSGVDWMGGLQTPMACNSPCSPPPSPVTSHLL